MASHSNTIIIADDEELPSLQPGGSRPRGGPRCDYSYREFEHMFGETDDETDTTPSRKRKRTEMKEPSALDNAFKELQKAIRHKMQRLREKKRMLRDELRQERERHRKTLEEASRQRERRVLECKICYTQPDRWVTIVCGHMICESCAGNLETPKKCPICRERFTGYIGCLPFAG
ncbi:unnamed protein product [Penicillium egyptiacum]|uniref:RING-type domain-containing protein n=1 Tax=Penicillium egyptiacum TaxID=1303716 RepID=A0A9W4P6S2_9EURO|nr:unnamed protein product [Penicillium egyptiacum]